ncbi:MAG: hypothetical protein PHI85_08650 [Victivallaceae bacterium]|nr:hypothetical protein [Victivallaceae bacterium]
MAFTENVNAENSPVIGETVDGAQTVASGGIAQNTTIVTGGKQTVLTGGVTSGVTVEAGGVLNGMGAGALGGQYSDVVVSGAGAAMQIQGAGTVVDKLAVLGSDFAKVELWDGASATNVKVNAGSQIAMGAGKVGAYLIVTGANAAAEYVEISNYGSASVYNGGYISDVTVSDGGVLAMSYRKLIDGSTGGVANNVTMNEGGVFWVGTLGSKAYNVTFNPGSLLSGFGAGANGTTFYTSWVVGNDGVTRELENWDGNDYTVVNGLTLLISNSISDGKGIYLLDYSKIILDGGAIQKSVEDNSFVFATDDDINIRVVDPVSKEILDSNVYSNWQVAGNQKFILNNGAVTDGLIVYEGGSLSGVYVGRPGPISAAAGTIITNGRYVFNDGTVKNFSCGNGRAENMIIEDGSFIINGWAGSYTEAGFGSGGIVKNTTMIGGTYVQGNFAYSDGVTVSNGTALQLYGYDTLLNGVNLDEAEDSVYRNFSIVGGVASGLIIENGGLLMLSAGLVSADGSLPEQTPTKAENIIVRNFLPEGGLAVNNNRADKRSYMTMASGTSVTNLLVGNGGYLKAFAGSEIVNGKIDKGGAFDIAIDAASKFEVNVNGSTVTFTGTALNDFTWDTSNADQVFTFTESGIAAITEVNNLVINSAGFNAGSNRVYNNVEVNATFNVGAGNTYNNVSVTDNTCVMYEASTINGFVVNGATSFIQFTTGTVTNTELWGGKIEAAGNLVMDGTVVDGTLFNTPVGEVGDSSPDHQTTQLVAYADGVVLKNTRIQNGGSAFLYNGATAVGSGNLSVYYPDGTTVATTTAGLVVDKGGVLYLTNWGLATDTSCTIEGDLWVNGGGTLYLGSTNNKIGRIQTMTGAIITGIANGTVIDSIILRGADIMIDTKLTINNVIQGNNQSIDGGTVGVWTNNYGILTLNDGIVSSYIQNNGTNAGVKLVMNGGLVENLNLTKNGAVQQILGGTVMSGTIQAGGISDAGAVEGAEINISNFSIGGTAAADFSQAKLDSLKVTGGSLNVTGTANIDGVEQTGGVINIYNAVADASVTSATMNIINPAGSVDGLKVYNATVTLKGDDTDNVMLNNATIGGTGKTTFIQAMIGKATNIVMNGGKYEAMGTHRIDGMIVDGANLDATTRNQLIAYAAGVTVDNLTLKAGGSAYFYNGANVGAGTMVEAGGVLYLTDRNLSGATTCNVTSDLDIYGELYMGGTANVFGDDVVIRAYKDAKVSGIASGTVIKNIELWGAAIAIADGVTINKADQYGDQQIDGGTASSWINHGGILTVNSGTVNTYTDAADAVGGVVINGGSVDSLTIANGSNKNALFGGSIGSLTVSSGEFYDNDWYTGVPPTVFGSGTIGSIDITGGNVYLLSDNTKVTGGVKISGGMVWVGGPGWGQNNGKVENITMTGGTTRIDGTVKNMVMSGGIISLAGGTIDGGTFSGGELVNWVGLASSGTVSNVAVTGVTGLSADSTIWNNLDIQLTGAGYINFGVRNTFNTLKSTNKVSFGSGSVINGAKFDSGAVVVGNNVTYNDIEFRGAGSWAQIGTGAVVNGLKMYDKTKFEACAGIRVSNAVIDGAGVTKADGSPLAFGDHKIGAHLGVYGADAIASGVQLINHGSATVFNGGKIEAFTATDGGALYLRGWSVPTTAATGSAVNGTITATGGIWYAGGTLKDVTIENGAWKRMEYSGLTIMDNVKFGHADGTYTTISCNVAAGTGALVLGDGDVFKGNWTAGGGVGAVGGVEVTMTDKATLLGWNLGSATIHGTVVFADGTSKAFAMGETNNQGGKHAQGVYFYNGSAVLGSGSATVDETGAVSFKQNTADDLYFDGGTFVLGGMTNVTNLKFVNGASLQTYSNANVQGVNLDEAEDSIYRNFSMSNGVASGVILDNGGFLQLFYAGQNWKGNTPSPAGFAKDMIVRGKRDAAFGNYGAANITDYAGGSFLLLNDGTGGDNVIVESGAAIRFTGSGANVTNLTLNEGAIIKIDAMAGTMNISGKHVGGDFSINKDGINNVRLDGALSYIKFAAGYTAPTITNLTLDHNAAIALNNATVNGMNIVNADKYYTFGSGNVVSGLTINDALVSFAEGNNFSKVTLTGDKSIATMYANSTIDGFTIDGGLTWTQFMAGTLKNATMLGGKIEAAGNLIIEGITIDGTKYHTEVGDTADTSADHKTTQLVAYSNGVAITNLRATNYGSAHVYNGALLIGEGNLTVTRASDGHVWTTSAGAVVESGGVLYMCDWKKTADGQGGVVAGELWVNEGGTLYLGNNTFSIDKIQTTGGATITGIVSNTTIKDIVLRGANITIDEKLTIENAIQGNNQSIDGGTVISWTNNYGVLTLNSGTVGTYVGAAGGGAKLVMSGGMIGEVNLTGNSTKNVFLGGTVESLYADKAGGGVVDFIDIPAGEGSSTRVYGSATLNGVTIKGNGGYIAGTWSWDGAGIDLWSDNSVANDLVVDGGVASIGRYDNGLTKATVNNVTVTNKGMLRIDSIANNVTLKSGTLSVYGGVIDGVQMTGGAIANYGSHRGTIKNATLSAAEAGSAALNIGATLIDWVNLTVEGGFSGYTTFGAGSTVNGLTASSSVAVGKCTTVTNVELNNGAVLTNYNGAAIDGLTIYGDGLKTWAQCTTGSVKTLALYGDAKYEAAGTNQVNGAVVDADGVEVAFKEIKVGAHLVLYAADVVANDVTLLNRGSATLYNGATLNNALAYDGGAVYMVGWKGETPAVGGTLNDAVIKSTGAFWYKGGVVNNITIESGATVEINASYKDKFSGTYVDIPGIGDLGFALKGDGTGSFVAMAGTTFAGNWSAGGGIDGSANLSSLWVFEGASLRGWNLSSAVVNGKYVDGEGNIHKMVMGASNEFGGKHAENVYVYNGSAVIENGTYQLSEAGDVTVKYNTGKGLIFDNSLFVLGSLAKASDVTFRNHVVFQTSTNAGISGVNYDEGEDSLYRNFSIVDGKATGLILENGGSLELNYAGQGWGGNAPSVAGEAQNIIVRGAESKLTMNNGTKADNVFIGSGSTLAALNAGEGTVSATNVTIEEGGYYQFNNVTAATALSGTYAGKAFSMADGVADGIVMDNDKLVFTVNEGIALNNGTFTAGAFALNGAGVSFGGTTKLALAVDSSKISKISGDFTATGIELAFGGEAVSFSGLTKLTVDGGKFSTQDNNMYGADIVFQGGAKVTWTGGSFGREGSASTMTVTGDGTTLDISWQHSGWGGYETVLNVEDGAQANIGMYTFFNTVNINKGGVYVADSPSNSGKLGTINVTDGWLQLDGADNTYTGKINVVGNEDANTYAQVIGTASGVVKVSGIGAFYVGSGKWGAGNVTGGVTVTTGSKDKGNVCLRNGSLVGLNMNGGTFWYSGSYRIADDQAAVTLSGDVAFTNAIINSGLGNTVVMDANSAASLKLGNYTTVNCSIDASKQYNISLGAELDFADGVNVSVGWVNAFDFSGAKSFVVKSVLATDADRFVTGEDGIISVGTITVHGSEGMYVLGDAKYLDMEGGITVKVGALSAAVTEFNKAFLTNESYGTTMTVKITVDENNQAVMTVFRTSSADKVPASWPTSWADAPILNIPVTAEDMATYAVNGVIGLQEAGPAAQAKFLYKDVANNTNNNLALIDSACNGAYVIGGMVKPNQWGARANTWLEVNGAQRVNVIGGGTAEGGKITNASNIYVKGADTSASVYGGGGAGFTVANVNIVVEDATINRLFGGGYADGSWDAAKVITGSSVGGDVTGNINVVLTNAVMQRVVIGGGYGNVGGNINVEVNNAIRSAANFYGGTTSTDTNTTVGGDISLKINGGMYSGMFVGGSFVYGNATSTINGNISISISGNTKQLNAYRPDFSETAWIIGGGYTSTAGTINVDGNVSINIVDSYIGNVVGGGAAAATGTSTSVGDIAIKIGGSVVTGFVFGGGYSNLMGVSKTGDVSITIDSTKATTIYGNIYAGGRGTASQVDGDVSVVFTGKGENLNFSGVVSGNGNITAVEGLRVLGFSNFTGEFNAIVRDFDKVGFSGNTVADMSNVSVTVDGIGFALTDRASTVTDAVVSGGEFTFNDGAVLDIIDADKFAADGSYVLFDRLADESVFTDATIKLVSSADTELGSFKLGESFSIDGYGTFTATMSNGAITLNFDKKDEPAPATGILA